MIRFFATVIVILNVIVVYAQAPQVPPKMHFANMTISIRDDARREIQKDVDNLTRNAKYYNTTAERARSYFPLISHIFVEEEVPDDFKYLALQESSLRVDAISKSNAVGFWQFKDFTALSMGLRVDEEIDERMNIASSTRGAAKYLKQNNEQFDNWILALQAYQMGAGGVKKIFPNQNYGERHFEVTSNTYWYIKKFIAHKIAFQDVLNKEASVKLKFLQCQSGKKLDNLTNEVFVNTDTLKNYNKWVLNGVIPADKEYLIVIPNNPLLDSLPGSYFANISCGILSTFSSTVNTNCKKINDIPVLFATEGETIESISNRGNISVDHFLRFNDISADHQLLPNTPYYLRKKNSKATQDNHQVKSGENLWSISQLYGITLSKLKEWNSSAPNYLPMGSLIWLHKHHHKNRLLPKLKDIQTSQSVDSKNEPTQPDVVSIVQDTVMAQEEMVKKDPIKNISIKTLPPDSVIEHVLNKGETMYSVSKKYQVKVIDIMKWNNLPVQTKLSIGQKLRICIPKNRNEKPTNSTSSDIESNTYLYYHEVKSTDTLYAIAQQYGISIQDLMNWNERKDFSIKKGEKLKIFKKQSN